MKKVPPAMKPSPSKGFTLIELLASVAIMGLLAALLVPVGNGVLQRARATQCAANLRQIYLGLSTYAAENNNCYPAAKVSGIDWDQKSIMPYLPARPDSRQNIAFICPSAVYTGVANRDISRAYSATECLLGIQGGQVATTFDVPRNLNTIANKSTSILLFDAKQNGTNRYSELESIWYNKAAIAPEVTQPNGTTSTLLDFRHPNNTAQVLMADGHVQTLKRSDSAATITKSVWQGL